LTRQRKMIDWKGHTVQHPPPKVWATATGVPSKREVNYAAAGRSLTRLSVVK
jgi:hypothetical protein